MNGRPTPLQDVIVREAKDTTWGLYPRYALMNEKLDAMLAAGVDGAGFLLTWSRLNSLRQLDWYRGYNYQSKDMDHMQKTLSDRLALAARSHKDPAVRRLVRATAAVLPRGGGDAEAIRMGILHIMRDFGIREVRRRCLASRKIVNGSSCERCAGGCSCCCSKSSW